MNDTKGYMIVVAKLTDRDAFISGYAKVVPPLIKKFGGRYLIQTPGAVTLEGDWGEGASIVLSEWPSVDAAREFWNSPEYEEAKALREGTGEFQVILVESRDLAAHFQ